MRPSLRWGLEMVLAQSPARSDPDQFPRLAAAVEIAGFGGVWLSTPVSAPMRPRDPLPLLGAMATASRRLVLGAALRLEGGRHPAVLAKQLTTLDVISSGRSGLLLEGLDAAQTTEAVEVCHAMFRRPDPRFAGRHYRIEGATNLPPPVAEGGPALVVGVSGWSRPQLRHLVARAGSIAAVAVTGSTQEVAEVRATLGPRAGSSGPALVWRGRLAASGGEGEVADLAAAGADGLLVQVGETEEWHHLASLGQMVQPEGDLSPRA